MCGIFNGIGEFVAGLFDLCALLVTITDKIERDKLVEKLENLYESFKKHLVEKIQKMLDDLFNYLIKRYTNKSEFENAYHKGEDFVTLFFIVEGLLAVVKLLRAIPKGFEKLVIWVDRNGKRLRGGIETIIKDEFIVLSKRIAEFTKGKIAIQNTKVLEELFAAAENANKELKTITEKFAKETGGEAGFRPETNNRGLKSKERSLEKIASDYGGDVSKLLDIAGSKVVYKTLDELYKALEKFFNEFEILKFKDRILNPLSTGYRDILMNIKMKNGHIVELRFHLKAMDEAAEIGHKWYEIVRTITTNAKKEGRKLNLQEFKKIQELEANSKKLYTKAWKKIIKN